MKNVILRRSGRPLDRLRLIGPLLIAAAAFVVAACNNGGSSGY